jgi:hypothetical protein
MADFIDEADLGVYLQRDFIDDSNNADPLATFAVTAACDVIRTYTNQHLNVVVNDDIKVDGTGTDALLLPEHPVANVASVAIGDDEPLTEDEDYVVGPYTGIVYRLNGQAWPRGRQNISVTYTHGYDIEAGDSSSGFGSSPSLGFSVPAVPETVRLVALQVAARIYAAGGTTDNEGNTAIGHLLPIERSVVDNWRLKGAYR